MEKTTVNNKKTDEKNMAPAAEMVRLCKEYREIKKEEKKVWETKYRPALESLAESTS